MNLQLPDGFSASRPVVADAGDIHELVASYDLAVIGRVDSTLDDIRDQLTEPGFDPARDSWLVRHDGGLVRLDVGRPQGRERERGH